jgi:hypothetical protein
VQRAIALKPDLVIVEIGGNEIKCDGQDASRLPAFRTAFASGLAQLTSGLPQARVLVVGEWGVNNSFIKTMLALPAAARLTHASKGPCSVFAPQSAAKPGSLVPAHAAYLSGVLKGIDAQRAAACSQYPTCHYDTGASEKLTITAADLSIRYDHLTISGNAKLAALEWAALKRLHLLTTTTSLTQPPSDPGFH